MAITQATTRADSWARHAEGRYRTAILGRGLPQGQWRLLWLTALTVGLAFVLVPASRAQISYPSVAGSTVPGYGGSPTLPAIGPSGTTFGVQPRPFAASIGVIGTLTNNVNLQPSGQEKSDFVLQLIPQVVLYHQGPHASLSGYIALPILLYARETRNDQVYPSVGLLGRVDAIDRYFYIEGAVSVSQQFLSPFGGQPVDLTNTTANRYTVASYRVSPVIQGVTPSNIRYELRDNNIWYNFYNAPANTSNSYYNQLLGNVASPVAPWGWAADYEGDYVKYQGQERPFITNLGRGRLIYQYDPQIQLTASGGYEDNRYTFTDYRGPIYGGGIKWQPSPRTNAVAYWEHRFFGSSYLFTFDTHGPLSVLSLHASRNISSYPQQFATIPPTGNVAALLTSIFSSRITDPTQLQSFVNGLIQDRGLPNELTSPVNLYTQQILLIEDIRGTVGLVGARNSVFLTGFYYKSVPISGAGNPLPPELGFANNNTQKGVGLTWTHKVTPVMTLSATLNLLRTIANPPFVGTTNQGNLNVVLSRQLSPTTQVFGGARYQKASSDVATDYTEAAVFAGFFHTFR
jgi:uncharacterized protein (PEP-CTERM system associated)